jgi:hypothetical protein
MGTCRTYPLISWLVGDSTIDTGYTVDTNWTTYRYCIVEVKVEDILCIVDDAFCLLPAKPRSSTVGIFHGNCFHHDRPENLSHMK